MTKVILALLFTLNIIYVLGAVTTGSPCDRTIGKFNDKVTKLVSNAKNQSDEWSVYSDIQSLKGLSFALKYTCVNESLEVVTKDTTQTPTELKACAKLQEIVQSFVPQKEDSGVKSDDKSVGLNKEILSAGKDLGENCTISLVSAEDDEEDLEEEEEDLGELAVISDEEESLNEEAAVEEAEEKKEVEEDSVYAKYINKYKPKNVEVEEEESAEEEDKEDVEEDNVYAKYINKYKPKNVEVEEEESAEEEKPASGLIVLNLINVNKKGKNDSGSEWQSGGYENYTNASQWQSGGYQKYYDQNKTSPQIF